MVLGLVGLLAITSIPLVTGVAEGISAQRNREEQIVDEERMAKFYIDVYCDANSSKTKNIHGKRLVLRDDRVFIDEIDPSARTKESYTARAFFIQYPDGERVPLERGIVSHVRDDPPLLNWLYVDKETMELRYGNKSVSIDHHVGDWDWTEDDRSGLIFEGEECFTAIETEDGSWQVYCDMKEDGLQGYVEKGVRKLQISLERTLTGEGMKEIAAGKK